MPILDHLNIDLDKDGVKERYDLQDKRVDDNLINYKYEDGKLTIEGGFSGGSGDTKHVYSTEEKVVGIWIDGKPIYEIVTKDEVSDIDILIYERAIGNTGEEPVSLIPEMTSETEPSGTASASYVRSYSGVTSYGAFNSSDSVRWDAYPQAPPQWIMYEFDEPITKQLARAEFKVLHEQDYPYAETVGIQISMDGSAWETLSTITLGSTTKIQSIGLSDVVRTFKFVRLYFSASTFPSGQARMNLFKLYGTDSGYRILQYTKTTD